METNKIKWMGFRPLLVRWIRWHCPSDTGFEIRALAVGGRACNLMSRRLPTTICNLHEWAGKKHFTSLKPKCVFPAVNTERRLVQCRFNVGPPSGTPADHKPALNQRPEFAVFYLWERGSRFELGCGDVGWDQPITSQITICCYQKHSTFCLWKYPQNNFENTYKQINLLVLNSILFIYHSLLGTL